MARAVEIALLTCLMAVGCNTQAAAQAKRAAGPATEQARLAAASRALYLTESGDDYEAFSHVRGVVGMTCAQTGRTVQLLIDRSLLKKFGVSVIRPDGTNAKIFFPMKGGYIGRTVTLKPADSGSTAITIERFKSKDINGGSTDGRYYPIAIWDEPGRYTFIVTGYLPNWYADSGGEPRPENQYHIKAFCSLVLH